MPTSMEKIIERTTITFPKPQNLKRVEKLLRYIATNLPANISCNSSYFTSFINSDEEIPKLLNQRGTIKITATIHSLRNPLAFDSLESQSFNRNTSRISALAFQLVPGWDISDYKPENLKLWSEVRELTAKYFSEKS